MMRSPLIFALSSVALMFAAVMAAPAAAQEAAPARVMLPTDRTVLPIPEPEYPHSTVFNALREPAQ